MSMPRSKGTVIGFWIVTALFCVQISFTAYAQLSATSTMTSVEPVAFSRFCAALICPERFLMRARGARASRAIGYRRSR
jgi:hypothetical protein